jgi:phosphatidate cytidylyltransferase
VSVVWLLRRSSTTRISSTWAATAATALYVGGLLFHAPVLHAIDDGREWVLFLLLATFATDICALLVGRAVGKRALAPSISPSKTWEGAAGGVLGAVATAVGGARAWNLEIGLGQAVGLGILIGIVGQLGDLIESRLKRAADVKDSGWLLPGHGGVLDRLDSIVLNLAVVYYFVS